MDDLLVSRYVNAFWACRIMMKATEGGRCGSIEDSTPSPLTASGLSRFGNLAPGWRERKGWLPPESATALIDAA
jgi:hypothetical protein